MAGEWDWATPTGGGTTVVANPSPAVSTRQFLDQLTVGTDTLNVRNSKIQYIDDADVGGTGDAISLHTGYGYNGHSDGRTFWFRAKHDNTGAATVNVDAIGNTEIRKQQPDGTFAVLEAGDIRTGLFYRILYDTLNSRYVLLLGGSSAAAPPVWDGEPAARSDRSPPVHRQRGAGRARRGRRSDCSRIPMSTSITVVGPLPMRAAGAASSSRPAGRFDLDLNFIFSRTENNRNDLGIRFFRFRDDAMGVEQQTALGAEDWGYSRGISTDDSSDILWGYRSTAHSISRQATGLAYTRSLNSGSETIPSAGVHGLVPLRQGACAEHHHRQLTFDLAGLLGLIDGTPSITENVIKWQTGDTLAMGAGQRGNGRRRGFA